MVIAVVAVIAVIIFVGIKYDPNKKAIELNENNKISAQEDTTLENYNKNEVYSDVEKEIKFVENVGNIMEEVDSAISSINNEGSDSNIDDFIYSERSFLRKLESLNSNLKNLNYPTSCISYRNNLCTIFDNLCIYERRLINSLEEEDSSGYDIYSGKINNSLGNLVDSYNSMVSYFQNKYR